MRCGHKQVCIQPPTSADNVTLLAFAAERRAAAPPCARRPPLPIEICCRPGSQQQTRRSAAACDGQQTGQRQTDGRTVMWVHVSTDCVSKYEQYSQYSAIKSSMLANNENVWKKGCHTTRSKDVRKYTERTTAIHRPCHALCKRCQ